MDLFNTILVNPMINMLVAIYQLLFLMHFPYALGFSIIIFTILVRFPMNPFMKQMYVQQKKMQELAPQLKKIKEKYKGDMQRQQQETMALYRSAGVNPAAGCLPVLIQFPLFIGLYWALTKIITVKSPAELNGILYADWLRLPKTWDTSFFGISLGQSPSQLFASLGIAVVLICVITAALQFVQSKMTMPLASKNTGQKTKEDDLANIQQQMMLMFPLLTGFISYTFPIGIALYWNTFTIFGIIQQYRTGGWGGMEPWIQKLTRKGK